MDNENTGLQLLKKRQTGIWQLIFGRMGIVVVLLILQILILIALFVRFEEYYIHYFGGTAILAVFMVLHLQNRQIDAATRTTWLIIVLAAPVFGSILYCFTRFEIGQGLLKRRVNNVRVQTKEILTQDEAVLHTLRQMDPGAASLCSFAAKVSDAVVYQNTEVTYFPTGEKKLERLLLELEKAEKFIYLEYFIISEGVMWGQILDVLVRKAAQGVDVRVIYDGTCEFILLPKGYAEKLRKLNIDCKVFSPFTPFVSTHYNFRDHRKILVIDGHTAFNGGINLSDEYINIGSRHGHWKDTAVMLKGEAALGFTLMFLQMWNLDVRQQDYTLPVLSSVTPSHGYVMPFGDSPMDNSRTGQRIYMDLINRARKQVCIMTPYLIIDEEMENCLCYAAARGVCVQLLLPGIPDKIVPYALAKTHYRVLLEAGVEVFEYSPGFDHAKVLVVDGTEAVIGTINFDYRSFYHHFECGTYLYGCACIADMQKDFAQCVQISRRVTFESIRNEKWYLKLLGFLLKGFEPLL